MSLTFSVLLPQSVLAALACLLILGGTFRVSPRVWPWAALGAIGLAMASMFLQPAVFPTGPEILNSGPVLHDRLTIGFSWAVLVAGALLVLTAWPSQAEADAPAEFYGLLLLTLAGTMLVPAANDLVLLLVALELISIPTYVLLYLGRRDFASQEAAVKYFLLSIMSSAVLLYGFALLYGLTGTTQLGLARAILSRQFNPVAGGPPSVLGVMAMVLIMAGLGFKLSAVPFHFYAPDVYQGTSAFNASLLAVIPKAAGLLALIRVANETLAGFEGAGERTALILAIITMTGGNVLALLQTNVRRLLAYSSVAHAGYMLIGIAVAFWDQTSADRYSLDVGQSLPGGAKASLLYLATYCVASVGLFAVLVFLARKGRQIDHVDELTGLGRTQPAVAIAAALFLFSMMGMPPLAGFWGKLAVFSNALSVRTGPTALHQGFVFLGVVGVLNAAIASVYYLNLIAKMFLNDPISHPKPEGGRGPVTAIAAAAVLVLALGIVPGPLFQFFSRISFDRPVPRETPVAAAGRLP